MSGVWIHYLLFTSVIGVGCLALSGLTRLFANIMHLAYRPTPLWRSLVALLGIGSGGAFGQLLFQALNQHLGVHYTLARLLGWMLAGVLITLSTATGTPFMPRIRACLVGALAGVVAWGGFCWGLGQYSETVARVVSALLLMGMVPMAVLYPLPQLAPGCDCHEDTGEIIDLVPEGTTQTYESVEALLTGPVDNVGIPGKTPIQDKIGIPGRISLYR